MMEDFSNGCMDYHNQGGGRNYLLPKTLQSTCDDVTAMTKYHPRHFKDFIVLHMCLLRYYVDGNVLHLHFLL